MKKYRKELLGNKYINKIRRLSYLFKVAEALEATLLKLNFEIASFWLIVTNLNRDLM